MKDWMSQNARYICENKRSGYLVKQRTEFIWKNFKINKYKTSVKRFFLYKITNGVTNYCGRKPRPTKPFIRKDSTHSERFSETQFPR
jgi:hypothetical protein